MATSQDEMATKLTFRKFHDGENTWDDLTEKIFKGDTSHKCPVYVHRTPPCQGSCPSGHDIRGWLDIVRGIEKPAPDTPWQEYAFRRATDSNPFPAVMGRVCPAPCEEGCNRNDVEEFVGINSVEQFIGDYAFDNNLSYGEPGKATGKKIAIIGGGPGGMAAAHQLRKLGHEVTLFDENQELGGMMRYGIPNYRIPRDRLDAEINRILDLGVDTRLGVKVGRDVSIEEVEKEHDAIIWAVGCQKGRALPVEGWDETPNCVTAVDFLKAYNEGRMKVTGKKVVCIGGGDTSIDVVSVTRRIGHNPAAGEPEKVIADTDMVQDDALAEGAEPAEATLTSLFPIDQMFAQPHEVKDALNEGVEILGGVMPVGLVIENGRAVGLKIADCDMDGMTPIKKEGTERVIEADLIVSAIGQASDMEGVEDYANDHGFMDVDRNFQVKGRPGHFAIGDILRPHLLTTAIGHASIAVESIDQLLKSGEMKKRPKVDKHHFNLLDKLAEAGLAPRHYDPDEAGDLRGTSFSDFAVHNFEDRAEHEIIKTDKMFLGHFQYTPRHLREEIPVSADDVLHHFTERTKGLSEEEAREEADRCMSCGLCFECDNCVIFCPQDAVYRVKKDEATTGRYVATDYARCVGCHICSDVCPTGYIDMAMGE